MSNIDDIRSTLNIHRDSESNQREKLIKKTKESVEKMILESLRIAVENYNVRRFLIGIELIQGEYHLNEYESYDAHTEDSVILDQAIRDLLESIDAEYFTVFGYHHGNASITQPIFDEDDTYSDRIIIPDKPNYDSIPYMIYNSKFSQIATGQYTCDVWLHDEGYATDEDGDNFSYQISSDEVAQPVKRDSRGNTIEEPLTEIFVVVVEFP